MVEIEQVPGSHRLPSVRESDLFSFPEPIRQFLCKNRLASQTFAHNTHVRQQWFLGHQFRPMAAICVDGRVQDFSEALGLPPGVLEIFRSAGAKTDCKSLSFCKRLLDSVRKQYMPGYNDAPKTAMFMQTVHYSESRPHDASCAAWNHETGKAVEEMRRRAYELNFAFGHDELQNIRQRVVAFPVMIDTDLDAMLVLGPNGYIATRELLDDQELGNGQAKEVIGRRLRFIFPENWQPLAALDRQAREGFYPELAELITANMIFVRQVIDSNRPVELLDHQEKLIFVGRHADWNTEHNAVFLIDDDNPNRLQDFEIALRYVAKNVILEATDYESDDWIIPVVINVPHDEDDRQVTLLYARKIEEEIQENLKSMTERTALWLRSTSGIPERRLTREVIDRCKRLAGRVIICTSVSDRATRLFCPFN